MYESKTLFELVKSFIYYNFVFKVFPVPSGERKNHLTTYEMGTKLEFTEFILEFTPMRLMKCLGTLITIIY